MVGHYEIEKVGPNKCVLCGKTRNITTFKSKNICGICINHVRGAF